MKVKILTSISLIVVAIIALAVVQITSLDLKPEVKTTYKSVQLNNS